MSNFSTLKSKIVTRVETLTDYFASSGAVFNYEVDPAQVLTDPFVIVIASGNESDFGNTVENRRVYSFTIRVYLERQSRSPEDTETLMVSIIDDLIDKIDQDQTLTGSALIIKAAPSSWGYVLSDKEYRVADVVVEATVWFDTSA